MDWALSAWHLWPELLPRQRYGPCGVDRACICPCVATAGSRAEMPGLPSPLLLGAGQGQEALVSMAGGRARKRTQ